MSDAEPTAADQGAAEQAGLPDVPGYEVLGEVGRGGMGIVYRARHVALNRVVALKMIRDVGPDETARLRFRREAEVLARLTHANIVQIHEVGEAGGLPFLALEFCPGGNLHALLAGAPAAPAEAARIVRVLAEAVEAAHRQGVVHRDLKPANVLLVGQAFQPDASAEVRLESLTYKITDFGLAKLLDAEAAASARTASGAVVGTPSYMAPEQAQGKKDVGPAADVYSLGAILYECLTGRPPFRGPTVYETLLQLLHVEPVPPGRLNPSVPRDLEAVCLKCLHKEPTRRYASARALADELVRFLDGKPTLARPVGPLGRGVKWARRHPAWSALLLTVVFAVAGMLGGAAWFTARADRLRQEADDNAADASTQLDLARRQLLTTQLVRVAGLWQEDPAAALALLDDEEACRPELRDFAWGHFRRLCTRQRALIGHEAGVTAVAASPDGRTLASADEKGALLLWDAASGTVRARLKGYEWDVKALSFSPDGSLLMSGGRDGTVRLWDVKAGRLRVVLGKQSGVDAVAFSPDGKLAASGGSGGTVRLWDVAAGKHLHDLKGQENGVRALAFTDGGRILLAGGWGSGLMRWRADTGEEITDRLGEWQKANGVEAMSVTPDHRLLAVALGGGDARVRLVDLRTNQVVREVGGFGDGRGVRVALAPDGKTLAVGEYFTGRVTLWDAETGLLRSRLPWQGGPVTGVAFVQAGGSSGRRHLLTGGGHLPDEQKPHLTFWDVSGRQDTAELTGHRPPDRLWAAVGVAFSRDGRLLASVGEDNAVRLWDGATGAEHGVLRGHGATLIAVAFAADGTLACCDIENRLVRWDPTSRRPLTPLPGAPERKHLAKGIIDVLFPAAFSADSRTAAGSVGSSVDALHIADATGAGARRVLPVGPDQVVSVAVSPDGATVATGHGFDAAIRLKGPEPRKVVYLWDRATGAKREFTGLPQVVSALAFSPDGNTLASGCGDGSLTLWDLGTARPRPLRGRHGRQLVTALCFSPDGQTLASGARDGSIRLWDVTTGQERAALPGHTAMVYGLAFRPDGGMLASASRDGTVRMWASLPVDQRGGAR